jgi:DNA-binding transcriptional MerR regulator
MTRRGLSHHDPNVGLLSIGALSAATGIPVDTIRTWERRYGFPEPVRKPSGHRVYPIALVPRLRRVVQAIARGHRAAEVLQASEGALEALLDSMPRVPADSAARSTPVARVPAESGLEEMLEPLRTFDADRLMRAFQSDWAQLGPLEFLEHRAAPFLRAVGEAWAEGTLDVRHEHFASAVLGDFLRVVRRPLDDRASGPLAALATLPGELHGLGLQMAALVFSSAGWRPLVLGVDTPISQIAALAREALLGAVALSRIQPAARDGTASVRELRRRLPRTIPLLVGGAGAPAGERLNGVEIFRDLAGLDQWLRSRTAA